jgi:outer membrane receptor protein involved in Fe transport
MYQQPAWSATAGAYYQFPRKVLGGWLAFNGDFQHASSWVAYDSHFAARNTTDANVGIKGIGGTGLDATIAVINVFNAKYDYGSFGNVAALGYRSVIFGQPRTVSLQLRYRFGE